MLLVLRYVVIVFLDMTASTFAPLTQAAGDAPTPAARLGGTVATASIYYILLAGVFGALRRRGMSLRKGTLIMLPLVLAVGLFNPFFDREIVLTLGSLPVSGGVISMLTLMLKGVLALTASFLLMATTGIDGLCAALRQLHVPGVLVTLLLLTYRYVGVMTEEVGVMTTAYHLRAPGQKGIHHSAWGSFLGQLLLRSMDRAGELYSSMLLRGFRDEFPYAESRNCTWRDAVWFTLCTGAFLFCRFVNAAQLLGSLVVR
jgi:cobalt/nickel transport system permease protein